MANPKELDKRRKSIRNIRKITRTMELIATARFKKAMGSGLGGVGLHRSHHAVGFGTDQDGARSEPPVAGAAEKKHNNAALLVLTANRGLCGGFNGNLIRTGLKRWDELQEEVPSCRLEIAGKRGIGGFEFRGHNPAEAFTHFEDKPSFDEVDVIASRFLDEYTTGRIDRLDVVYMKFHSIARQEVAIETLLPLGSLSEESPESEEAGGDSQYEFVPSPESILEEVVPTSFKVKLFKCFLDSAVSEQVARMVAMKGATEKCWRSHQRP